MASWYNSREVIHAPEFCPRIDCFAREDACSMLSPFSYERQPGLKPSLYNQQFMQQQYYVPPKMSSMQMKATFTHSPAHAIGALQFSDLATLSQENAENRVQMKKMNGLTPKKRF